MACVSFSSWCVPSFVFADVLAEIAVGDYGCGFQLPLSCSNSLWSAGDVSLGRYNKSPRMRVQKAENVTKALDFIASRGVKLTNIGPEGDAFSSTAVRAAIHD